MKYYNNKARQAGMTLIELTVVLLVLIGLAGLLIPYVSGFVGKTHDSTGTQTIAALNNAIQRHDVEFRGHPDNYESLISTIVGADASGNCLAANAPANDVYCKLMNPGVFGAELTATYPGIAVALKAAGIDSILQLDNQTTDATFAATNAAGPVPVDDATVVAYAVIADEAGVSNLGTDVADEIEESFGIDANTVNAGSLFVALGIGQGSQMVGRTISDAPIHFAQNGAMGPTNKYNHYVAIYEIEEPTLATTEKAAKYVGTGMAMMSDHFFGFSHSMGHAYENIAAQ